MKRIDFRRVFVITGLMALVVVYAVLWLRMITSVAERTGTDFISPYSAARIAQRWGASNVYNLELQRQFQEEVVGFNLQPGQVLMFNHPPYLVPLLVLLINGNYVASFIRYVTIMLALYAACGVIIAWLLRRAAWKPRDILLLLAGILTFYPLFVSLINAQDTAILVLGAFLWLAGILTGRDWLAGLGLAMTSVRPHITVLLALPFLFKRRKVFGWFTLAIVVLGMISLLVLGPNGVRTYLQVLFTAAGGDYYGMNEPAMVNLVGLLWRFVPGLGANGIHLIGWVTYGITLTGLCVLWARNKEITGKQLGVAITVSLFAVPHLHYHDLSLLVVALLPGLEILVRRVLLSARDASLAPLSISFFLLLSSLVPQLKFNVPYLVMALLFLLLSFPVKIFFWRRQASEIIP